MTVLREIAELQRRYELLCKKGMTKRTLCDLVIPFRDKYGLSDADALRITRNQATIPEIVDMFDRRTQKEIHADVVVHHYKKVSEDGYELAAAFRIRENDLVSVSGIEYSEENGYAYFTFDAYANDEDLNDPEGFMAFLYNNETEGFSCAWYDTPEAILAEYGEDPNLAFVVKEFTD